LTRKRIFPPLPKIMLCVDPPRKPTPPGRPPWCKGGRPDGPLAFMVTGGPGQVCCTRRRQRHAAAGAAGCRCTEYRPKVGWCAQMPPGAVTRHSDPGVCGAPGKLIQFYEAPGTRTGSIAHPARTPAVGRTRRAHRQYGAPGARTRRRVHPARAPAVWVQSSPHFSESWWCADGDRRFGRRVRAHRLYSKRIIS
jgi:hypothetical protein